MDSDTTMLAERLLERANHLRQMAGQVRSRGIAVELERIARRYEADAAHLEMHGIAGLTMGRNSGRFIGLG